MIELIGGVAAGLGSLGLGAALVRTLWRYRPEADEGSATTVSLERYAVLSRLTSAEDLEFLQQQPGYHPDMARQFKRQRAKIIRLYLRELAADFARLHREARKIAAEAPEEHADVVGQLMRQQVTFLRCLATIEVRLALAPLGIGPIDVSELLATVEQMRLAAAPSAA
jgi:hypothetical protein